MKKIKDILLLTVLFLLPFQTRYFYSSAYLKNIFWEYGSLCIYGIEILVAVLVLIDLYQKFSSPDFVKKIKLLQHGGLVRVLAFVSVLALYLFFSPLPKVTWQYFETIFYAVILAVLILESKLSFDKLALAFWGGGLLQACLGVWQFFGQSVVANKWFGIAAHTASDLGAAVVGFGDERWLRAYGSFGWPTSLGVYLAVVFLIGTLLLLRLQNNRSRSFVFIGQMVILSGLFFTFARGAWLALLIALCVLVYQRRKNILIWKQLFFYAAVFLVLVITFRPLVFNRFNLSNRLEIKSVTERVNQWSDFKKVFKSNIVLGTSPGLYTYSLYSLGMVSEYSYQPVHNIFLLFLGEWGVFGLLVLSSLLYFGNKFFNWLFSPFLAILIFGCFDHWIISMFTGWLFLAVVLALGVRYRAIDTSGQNE